MKFILGKSRDAACNLAMEEYVLENCRDDDYFILWVNEPSIIIGKFQNIYQEIDVREAYRQKIPVYRRNSGGGCVYHDEGNLNFSFITDWKMEENTYSRFLNVIIAILREHNVPAYQTGICNLSLQGKKISGNAQTIHRKRILHHGTLLFDTDLCKIKNIIRPDYEHYISKAMKSVSMPVMNISERFGCEFADMEDLKRCILKGMGYRPEYEFKLSPEAGERIKEIKKTKYCSWEWNYEKGANFEYYRRFEAPEGIARYKVEKGILKMLWIEHELLPEERAQIMARALQHRRFSYPEMHEILQSFGESGRMVENMLF